MKAQSAAGKTGVRDKGGKNSRDLRQSSMRHSEGRSVLQDSGEKSKEKVQSQLVTRRCP